MVHLVQLVMSHALVKGHVPGRLVQLVTNHALREEPTQFFKVHVIATRASLEMALVLRQRHVSTLNLQARLEMTVGKPKYMLMLNTTLLSCTNISPNLFLLSLVISLQ